MKSTQSSVVSQPKSSGWLGFLKPFISAGATALGGPLAGAGAGAAMDLASGNTSGAASGIVQALSSPGVDNPTDNPGETTPPKPATQPEAPKKDSASTIGQGGGQSGGQGGGAGTGVLYSPEQRAMHDQIFSHVEKTFPELPVFISQNPEEAKGLLGFLAQAIPRYAPEGEQQQGGQYSG